MESEVFSDGRVSEVRPAEDQVEVSNRYYRDVVECAFVITVAVLVLLYLALFGRDSQRKSDDIRQ